MLNKKTVDDLNVKGKRVLVRCDFNVPVKDGVITDDNRITASLPTIRKLMNDGAKVILCSHMGKPKGEVKPELSLAPVAERLSEKLGVEVKFAKDDNVVGENAKAAARKKPKTRTISARSLPRWRTYMLTTPSAHPTGRTAQRWALQNMWQSPLSDILWKRK